MKLASVNSLVDVSGVSDDDLLGWIRGIDHDAIEVDGFDLP